MAIVVTNPSGVTTGGVQGPPGASSVNEWEFTVQGVLTTGVGITPLPIRTNKTLVSAIIAVAGSPTGSAIIIDINLNGTTIFTTQGNRPQIAAGQTTSIVAVPDVTSAPSGGVLTFDIDQVGSTTPGSTLVLVLGWSDA